MHKHSGTTGTNEGASARLYQLTDKLKSELFANMLNTLLHDVVKKKPDEFCTTMAELQKIYSTVFI